MAASYSIQCLYYKELKQALCWRTYFFLSFLVIPNFEAMNILACVLAHMYVWEDIQVRGHLFTYFLWGWQCVDCKAVLSGYKTSKTIS